MDKLQWFKFSYANWRMGKIQRCSEVTQARFLNLCCLYWSKECFLSYEDAEIEIDKDHLDILIKKKIIYINEDMISISFLDEQFAEIQENNNNKRKSGIIGNLKRWHSELYNKYKRKEISLEDAINQSQSIADQSHTDNKPIADQSQSIAEKKREDKNRIDSKEKFANNIRLLSTNLPKSEIEKFIDYWTEKNPNGKKMKFEKQKTFDPNLRLKRWESNYKEFKKVGTNNPPTATKKQLK